MASVDKSFLHVRLLISLHLLIDRASHHRFHLQSVSIVASLGRFEEYFLPGYLGDAIAIWLLEETGQIQRNTAAA